MFLVSSGCPAEYARDDHASALCVLAVDMMAVVKAFKVRHDETRRTSVLMMNAVPQLFSRPSMSTSIDDDRPASLAAIHVLFLVLLRFLQLRLSHLSHLSRPPHRRQHRPVIAGVVGVKYPRYRLMGDTINTASRMSTTCERGEIQLSSPTYAELNSADFVCQQRSRVEVKGKGLMQTYILKEHKLSHRTAQSKSCRPSSVCRMSPCSGFLQSSNCARQRPSRAERRVARQVEVSRRRPCRICGQY